MAEKKSIGLPGGPNEFLQDITQYISVDGYKRHSDDVTNPVNIIESSNITMEDVDFPVYGVDNLGNEQMMFPENDYQFPGNMVMEMPMLAKNGRELPKAQWGALFKKLPQIGRQLGKNADELVEYFSKNIDEFKKWYKGDDTEETITFLKDYVNDPKVQKQVVNNQIKAAKKINQGSVRVGVNKSNKANPTGDYVGNPIDEGYIPTIHDKINYRTSYEDILKGDFSNLPFNRGGIQPIKFLTSDDITEDVFTNTYKNLTSDNWKYLRNNPDATFKDYLSFMADDISMRTSSGGVAFPKFPGDKFADVNIPMSGKMYFNNMFPWNNKQSIDIHEWSHLFDNTGRRIPLDQQNALINITKNPSELSDIGGVLSDQQLVNRWNRLIGKPQKATKQTQKSADYYQDATEIKARILQIRKDLNILPSEEFTQKHFDKVGDMHGMRKYLNVDEDNGALFIDFMNTYFNYGGPVADNITHNKTTGLSIPTPVGQSGKELPEAQDGWMDTWTDIKSSFNPYNYSRTEPGDNPLNAFFSGDYEKMPTYYGDDKDKAFSEARDDLGAGKTFLHDGVRYKTDYAGETEHIGSNFFFATMEKAVEDGSNKVTQDVLDRFKEIWTELGQPNLEVGDDKYDHALTAHSWDELGLNKSDHVNPLTDKLFVKEYKTSNPGYWMDAVINELTHVKQQREMGRGPYLTKYITDLIKTSGDQGALYDRDGTLENEAHRKEHSHNDILSNYIYNGVRESDNKKYGGDLPKAQFGALGQLIKQSALKAPKYLKKILGKTDDEILASTSKSATSKSARGTVLNEYGQILTSFDDKLNKVPNNYNEISREGVLKGRGPSDFKLNVRGVSDDFVVQVEPLKKGTHTPEEGMMQLIKNNKKNWNAIKNNTDNVDKSMYDYFIDMSMQDPLDAGSAMKFLEEYIPKGSTIGSNASLSLDSYRLMLNRIKRGKFSAVPNAGRIDMNVLSKNLKGFDVNSQGMITKGEADDLVTQINKMLDETGISERALATKHPAIPHPFAPELSEKLVWKVDLPNLLLKMEYEKGGSLPKAQFGRNSIMSGNAYGLRPEGSTGVLGDIYKKTGFDKFAEEYIPETPQHTVMSGLLDILSVPANLMTEAVEYFGERGDKEFNFSDAMPGFSGDFSFTNANDEPLKTVSQTTDDEGNKLVDNFWGGLALDIFTDPTTYIGAGLIKNAVTKGPKVIPKVIPKVAGKTDDVVEAVTKQATKASDEVVEASNKGFKSEIDWSKWNTDIPNNKALMKEYTEIEKLAKTDGTWMKNADGSPFTLPDGSLGTAEQFVQTNSKNFKNAYPKGIDVTYRGSDQHIPEGMRGDFSSIYNNDVVRPKVGSGLFTGNLDLAGEYGLNNIKSGAFPYFTSTQKTLDDIIASGGNKKSSLSFGDEGGIYKLAIPTVDDASSLTFDAGRRDWTQLNNPRIWNLMPDNVKDAATKSRSKTGQSIMFDPNKVYKPTFATDDVATMMEQLKLNRVNINNVYDFGVGDVMIHNNKKGNFAKSLFGNDGTFNLNNKNIYRATMPITIGGSALTEQQKGNGEWQDIEINLEGIKKGIAQAESSGGVLMLNPKSSATGLYGQRFSEIEDGGLYDGTRVEFSQDLDAQDKLFNLRLNEGIKINETTPLLRDAWDLTQEYKEQLGDDWNFSYEDIIGLSNFLGRKGARKFFGNVIRDGKPLSEVYPNLYGEDIDIPNKTPEEYLDIIREFYADGGEKIHRVTKGENLSRIARQYNTSVDDIVSANDIPNPSLINIDQELVIPAGIVTPSGPSYKVKKGDTLNEIAKSHNVSWHTLARINNLDNPDLIIAGQDLILPDTYREQKPLSEEKWISVEKLQKNNDDVNALTDENIIVKSQMINDPNQRYVVVDKKNQRLKLYHGDEVITDFEILTGTNKGDAQTVTVPIDQDGDRKITEADKVGGIWKVDWSKGNLSTGAGKYTISQQSPTSIDLYNNAPSFNLVNEAGVEVSTAIHGAPDYRLKYFNNEDINDNRSSNGCINGKCSDLQGLYDMGLPTGTPVYVLPEDQGNTFQMVDGKASLRMSQDNREKYQKYNVDGESRRGQGGNYSTNTLSYKPIRAQFDEVGFRNEIFTAFDFNDEKELKNTTMPFISALVENKREIMKEAQIPGDVYNQIAKMAFGIYGAESHFGDTHSAQGNFMRAANKYSRQLLKESGVDVADSSSPDVDSKYNFYNLQGDNRSVGYTQMRWSHLNEREKKSLKKMKINSNADLLNPEKAAIATALVLGIRYNEQLSSKQKKNMWLYLPTKWNQRPNYGQRVKHNSRFLNFEQFDRMTTGGEIENLAIYKNYISGTYDDTKMEDMGVKIYDKLNRMHYKQAKELGMSPANYVMTYVINDS